MISTTAQGARLAGQAAIVTGGAAGIGLAIAQGLYANGASVLIADIAGAAEAALAIDPSGARVTGRKVDVASDVDVEAMVSAALEAFGRCDVLVNNAGIATSIPPCEFQEIPLDEWRRIFEVNVYGIFRCCRAVVPTMIERGGGRIINIGSAAAFKGVPNLLHYVSSKGAVLAMTRSLAKELGARNITVNSVAPGFTLSPAVLQNPGQLQKTREGSLLGRAIPRDQYPEDLVGSVVFFASADASFITGQTLVVDGGTYMH